MKESEIKKHLEEAEKSPRLLAAAVAGLPEKILRFKPSPDKWCIREIVGHLADLEIVYGFRIRQIIAEEKPVIMPMDQNAWARSLGYMEAPVPELVALFGVNRHHNLRLLKNLKSVDFAKGAYHPELKREMTLENILVVLDEHTASHLAQIEGLKKAAK